MATTRSRPTEDVPPVEARTVALGDIGPISLGVSVGIQVLLAGLLFVPAPGRPAVTTISQALSLFNPEWDGVLYVVCGAVGAALAVGFCLVPARWRRLPRVGPVTQVALALAGVAGSLAVFRHGRRELIAGDRVSLVFLGVLLCPMAAAAIVGLLGRPSPPAWAPSETVVPRRWAGWKVDVLIAVVIVAVFYQPGSTILAGWTLNLDSMLHWDYFAMGPTLAYHAGAALGTDVYVLYGVGWPVLFSALSPVVPISYTHMIVVVQIAGCAYLLGAFLFVKLLCDRIWAVIGVILVLVFGVFAGAAAPFSPYWGFPSLTVVRGMFDVWFFAALVLSLRSSHRRWDVVAGALVGLAILFALDTGVYLTASMAFFWLCRGAVAADRHEVGRRAAAATAAGAVVVLGGAALASRGTLVHLDFWSGWVENLRVTSSGLSMEPLATAAPAWTLGALVLMMAVYLGMVSHALVGALRGRITTEALVLGTLASYGFLVTLYFVGRSTPWNLVRCTAPFALLVAGLASRGCVLGTARLRARVAAGGGAGDRRPGHRPLSSTSMARRLAVVALGVSLVLLAVNPWFRDHRGLAQAALGAERADGVCKFDFCGLAPDWAENLDRVSAVADRLTQLAPDGERVAVLDQTGPLVHLLSGTVPWGRYTPLLLSLHSPERLRSVIDDLESDPPDVAIIRTDVNPVFEDTVAPLRTVIRKHFDLDSEVAGFQIWRLTAGLEQAAGKPVR